MDTGIFYEEIVKSSLSLTIVTDIAYQCVYVCDTSVALLQYDSKEELCRVPIDLSLFSVSAQGAQKKMLTEAREKGASATEVLTVRTKTGAELDIIFRCQSIGGGKYFLWSGVQSVLIDEVGGNLLSRLNAAKRDIEELKDNDFKMQFALDCAESINWELSSDLKMIYFSKNFDEMMGLRQEDYGFTFDGLIETHLKPHRENIIENMRRYISGETDMYTVEISMYDHKGKKHWLLVRGKYLNDERKVIYGISVYITKYKELEQRLAKMAYIDEHTGLYKSTYVADAFAGLLESVTLHRAGLMVLNIQRFSDINAIFGYERGNVILKLAAKRLASLTNGLLACHSGAFIIALNDAQPKKLAETASDIHNAFERPIEIEGQTFYINFKIGIALNPHDSHDYETLLKYAEMAVNHIKSDEAKNTCTIDDLIKKNADERFHLENELHKAVENHEFVLYFQPIINKTTEKITAAEALIRWMHPVRGIISPAVFIPLAEQTGLINTIGDFVLLEAVNQLKKCIAWNKDFYISINVSVTQLISSDFIGRVEEVLRMNDVPPANLVVEVTESVFIADADRIIAMLNRLRTIGVRVSLDDFGTGYSSLSYLKKIPLNNLKIDQSFLQDVSNDPKSEAILTSIMSLARDLDLTTTVEGVETAGHMELLKNKDCDYLQGYFFSKPVPAKELNALLNQ